MLSANTIEYLRSGEVLIENDTAIGQPNEHLNLEFRQTMRCAGFRAYSSRTYTDFLTIHLSDLHSNTLAGAINIRDNRTFEYKERFKYIKASELVSLKAEDFIGPPEPTEEQLQLQAQQLLEGLYE